MNRIKAFYNKYLAWINAYWLVTIVFLIVTLTVGDSSLYKRYMYDRKIHSLEREIKAYREEIKINSEKLNNLRTDKEGLERFAREEYLMKRENEDIYIIKSKLPVRSRCGRYQYFLLDFARQGSKFQTKKITPLQCFCGVIDDLRLRSDVRRPQRVDHLPLHRGDPASLYSLRIRRQEKGSK